MKNAADSHGGLSAAISLDSCHLYSFYIGIGPWPIHEVVVMAVRKAVRAATTTFTATSITRFVFIIPHFLVFSIPQNLIFSFS